MITRDIFIKSGEKLTKFELDEIYFFTKKDNKTIAVFKNDYIEVNTSLYDISNLLGKDPSFLRTHKSFIVNRNKIKTITKYTENTYNIKFLDIKLEAYITKKNLKLIKEKSILL